MIQDHTNNLVNQLVVRDQNMKARRIVNASASKDPHDYTIKKELTDQDAAQTNALLAAQKKFDNKLVPIVDGSFLASLTTVVIGTAAATIAFFGGVAIVKQILAAYTPNLKGTPYVGLATGLGGLPYGSNANLDALRIAYENLRASHDDLRTKLLATTLVG